jgi:hypothetical protein
MQNYEAANQESIARIAETNPDIWKEVFYRTKMLALVARIKCGAKRKKIPFDLNPDNLSLPVRCPVLGMELSFNTVAADDNSYSIDRVDNTRGYTMDNICIMSLKANKMKSNGTLEELVKLGEWAKAQLILRGT